MDQDYKGFVQKAPDQIIKHLPSNAYLNSEAAIRTLKVFLHLMAYDVQFNFKMPDSLMSSPMLIISSTFILQKCTETLLVYVYTHAHTYTYTQGCTDPICQFAISVDTELIKQIGYLP